MFEATADPRTAEAVRAAHAERSRAFTGLFRKLFSSVASTSSSDVVPLGCTALTEPSR